MLPPRLETLYSTLHCGHSGEDHAFETTQTFVEPGSDPLEPSSSGRTLLHAAVESGLASVTQYLLSLGIPPSPDLLHVALQLSDWREKLSMIVCLVRNGADVHARTATGDPVLHAALQSIGSCHKAHYGVLVMYSKLRAGEPWEEEDHALEITKAFAELGYDPLEASSSDGKTLLHVAVESGHVSVTQYLLSLDIHPSPDLLHAALELRDVQERTLMIVCLVKNGADGDARTAAGVPVLHTVLQSFQFWDGFSFESEGYALETMKVFINHGCNPVEACAYGKPLLRAAVKRGLVSVTQYFLSLGIPPSPDLLHVALELKDGKRTPMIVCLVKNGIDLHSRTAAGDPVLHTVLQSFRYWEEVDAL